MFENYAAARTRSRQRKKAASPERYLWGSRTARRGQVNNVVELLSLPAPTMCGLPPPNTQRWVVRRKGVLVAAVAAARITMEEALRRYQLTEEQFLSWQRAPDAHGLAGLSATRIQQYRGSRRPRDPRSRR